VRSTQQFSITLPNEMADQVRSKVASGEYATESEVIREGLRTLLARDRAMEAWLREQVLPAAQALKADPGRALTSGQVHDRLATKRQRLNACASGGSSAFINWARLRRARTTREEQHGTVKRTTRDSQKLASRNAGARRPAGSYREKVGHCGRPDAGQVMAQAAR